MVAGKTVGGTPLYPEDNRLDRTEALGRSTLGSAWYSSEEDKQGAIAPDQLADLAVLSADDFSVPEEDEKRIESMLTMVGGKIVYGSGAFAALAPPPWPIVPDWLSVRAYGGYHRQPAVAAGIEHAHACAGAGRLRGLLHRLASANRSTREKPLWWPGCECFAF
jgi:hypothetical protein